MQLLLQSAGKFDPGSYDHHLGPFVAGSPLDRALSIQLFLIVLSIPLLFLAAVIEERQRSKAALRSSGERFAKAFISSPDAMVITRTNDQAARAGTGPFDHPLDHRLAGRAPVDLQSSCQGRDVLLHPPSERVTARASDCT